jgi:hypothetical protein
MLWSGPVEPARPGAVDVPGPSPLILLVASVSERLWHSNGPGLGGIEHAVITQKRRALLVASLAVLIGVRPQKGCERWAQAFTFAFRSYDGTRGR